MRSHKAHDAFTLKTCDPFLQRTRVHDFAVAKFVGSRRGAEEEGAAAAEGAAAGGAAAKPAAAGGAAPKAAAGGEAKKA